MESTISFNINHEALISISVEEISGATTLASIALELTEVVDFKSVSSIYRVPLSSNDGQFGYFVVVRMETPFDADTLLSAIYKVEQTFVEQGAHIVLLAWEDLISMVPQLTLPHPTLVSNPLVLHTATEVWDQYFHPVLGKTLLEIAKAKVNTQGAEFFAQGKQLMNLD